MSNATTKENYTSCHNVATHQAACYTREYARNKGVGEEIVAKYVYCGTHYTYNYKRANLLFFCNTTKTFFTFV